MLTTSAAKIVLSIGTKEHKLQLNQKFDIPKNSQIKQYNKSSSKPASISVYALKKNYHM